MKKAKLTLVAVMLSHTLINSAAPAAQESKTISQDFITRSASSYTGEEAKLNAPGDESISKLTELALGGMSDLGGILTSDMSPPGNSKASAAVDQGLEDKLAIGGADVAPSWGQHSSLANDGVGTGQGRNGPSMGGQGSSKMGLGMKGCFPMGHHHYRCPWEKLEGSYALTDDQYQKFYDIKGQFIASIVPKGLNLWMLGRKMKDLLNVGDVDTNAVKDVEKQIAAATSDLSMTAMDSIIAANQVLTPAQRKELHKMSIRSTLGGSGQQDKDSHSDK